MTTGHKIVPDELFVQLLIGDKYRPLRHIALVLMLIGLSLGNVNSPEYRSFVSVLNAFIFIPLPILLNVYVFVPRLLLRNRPLKYAVALITVVLVSLLMANYILYADRSATGNYSDYPEESMWLLDAFSTLLMFILILAGTTSMIILQLWLRDRIRIAELEEASNLAELEMLKNQINPHFLFNMLNNAIVLTKEDSTQAGEVILKLREMLNYQFEMSNTDRIPLQGDIDFLDDLLHLEQIRRDKFDYHILVIGEAQGVEVPPLLFIPFVENALKHGNDNTRESYIQVIFKIGDGKLSFFCTNSLPAHAEKPETGGLGLRNIKRRLELIYGDNHSLDISGTDRTYTVNLTLEL